MLIYLGVSHDRLVSTAEVANAYGISQHHLVKVVQHLSQHGYVETIRGRGGGMRLACDAVDINVGAVVRNLESSNSLLECFDPATNACPIAPACSLLGLFKEAQEAFLQVLDSKTLADIVRRPRAYQVLIGLSP